MKKNTCAGLEQILVDKGHDADIVFGAGSRGYDGVVIIDELLEVSDTHGAASHVINTASFVGVAVQGIAVSAGGSRLLSACSSGLAQSFLVLDVFLL